MRTDVPSLPNHVPVSASGENEWKVAENRLKYFFKSRELNLECV